MPCGSSTVSFLEIMDCIWVTRRGVLNPIQVRQEFIDTMGREPTIAEVHDLYDMIQSEYNQAHPHTRRDRCCWVHLQIVESTRRLSCSPPMSPLNLCARLRSQLQSN